MNESRLCKIVTYQSDRARIKNYLPKRPRSFIVNYDGIALYILRTKINPLKDLDSLFLNSKGSKDLRRYHQVYAIHLQ